MTSTPDHEDLCDTDEDAWFARTVSDYLERGAARLRSMSADEYVRQCRALWHACETDQVFTVRLLIDKLTPDPRREGSDCPRGFEVVRDENEPPEDLYCVAIGAVRPDGSFVGAPQGYDPTPTNPRSHRRLVLALPSSIPVDEDDEAQPGPYVLGLFDVLGFANRLEDSGLERMHEVYRSLVEVALRPHVAENQWTGMWIGVGAGLYSPAMFWLPIRYAYFSDTMLLWVPYGPQLVGPFLDRVLNVFCEALRLGLPLRGAVGAGTVVLHQKSNTFLGPPLVEAARLHDAQEWIGAACGVSVRSETMRIPFSPAQVMLYDAPLKAAKHAQLLSGLVLGWPRRWRGTHGGSAHDAVSKLRATGYETYYDRALEFVDYSDRNPEWFMSPGLGRAGPPSMTQRQADTT